ncbi:hypothetical protein HID58_051102 [Brassica napus]|uniref:Uncharacterized protein n=1 Tax=Brassica napus TaxID=3708 RepID=A0ABQ8A8E3_BRANA|nr:hypothetical protein HID58_051102 [Brassica napus]
MNSCWCCGPVVSGNENKLDVSIVADRLTTEKLSLYDKEFDYLLCDLKYDAEESLVHGKVGIVKDDDEDVVEVVEFARQGMPVVEEIGTMIFAEIKQLNEPIDVKITEWNIGGLFTRLEGLRGFNSRSKC